MKWYFVSFFYILLYRTYCMYLYANILIINNINNKYNTNVLLFMYRLTICSKYISSLSSTKK